MSNDEKIDNSAWKELRMKYSKKRGYLQKKAVLRTLLRTYEKCLPHDLESDTYKRLREYYEACSDIKIMLKKPLQMFHDTLFECVFMHIRDRLTPRSEEYIEGSMLLCKITNWTFLYDIEHSEDYTLYMKDLIRICEQKDVKLEPSILKTGLEDFMDIC